MIAQIYAEGHILGLWHEGADPRGRSNHGLPGAEIVRRFAGVKSETWRGIAGEAAEGAAAEGRGIRRIFGRALA